MKFDELNEMAKFLKFVKIDEMTKFLKFDELNEMPKMPFSLNSMNSTKYQNS